MRLAVLLAGLVALGHGIASAADPAAALRARVLPTSPIDTRSAVANIWDGNSDGFEVASAVNPVAPASPPGVVMDAFIDGRLIGTMSENLGAIAVGSVGDVNGDGRDELFAYERFIPDRRSYVVFGTPLGIGLMTDTQADMIVPDFVRRIGDVDADGYEDVGYFGAVGFEVHHGGASGIAAQAGSVLTGLSSVSTFSTGDVNGDGYDDLAALVGSGDLVVFHGSAVGLPSGGVGGATSTITGGGRPLGGGDFDNDGYADIVATESDLVRVFAGSPSGVLSGGIETAAAILQPFNEVRILGDVNDDGYADLGAYQLIASGEDRRSSIFHGSATGITGTGPNDASAEILQDELVTLAALGDVNGDGIDDIGVTGTSHVAENGVDGAVFVYLGMPGGIGFRSPSDADIVLDGLSLAIGLPIGAADVNGDGFGDVIVYLERGNNGEVAVFHGGPPGAAPIPSSGPAAQLGLSVLLAGGALRRLRRAPALGSTLCWKRSRVIARPSGSQRLEST